MTMIKGSAHKVLVNTYKEKCEKSPVRILKVPEHAKNNISV